MDQSPLIARTHALFPTADARCSGTIQPLPGMMVFRQGTPTVFEADLYEPVICLILQGWKEVTLGERSFAMRAGTCLLISHDLPVLTRIPEAPYLALLFAVDLPTLRGLYDEVGALDDDASVGALEVQPTPPDVFDAARRYVELTGSPRDAAVLGPGILRELHYRLLTGPSGGMLRSLIRHDSHASAIARAIAVLRRDLRAPLTVPELARQVGMSASSFHKHFKAVTASTPLQYQKDLRLVAARRMLRRAGAPSVAEVAYAIGYESASQFSREYARKFGHPPSRSAKISA